MMFYTEEIMNQFVAESRKYLEKIEDDLYALRKHKFNPDISLVDKIFRVYHTIKEGAAFLGLKNITDLALVMEDMAAMIRIGEIKPEPVFVNALKTGATCLQNLLDNVACSNNADISSIYKTLSDLLGGEVSDKVKKELNTYVPLLDMNGEKTGFDINRFYLKNIAVGDSRTYVLKFDLMELSSRENMTPLQLIRQLLNKGEIIEGRLKTILEDLRAGLPRHPLIYEVLYATGLDLKRLRESTGLPENDITLVNIPKPADDFTAGNSPFEVFRDFILPDLCARISHRDIRGDTRKSWARIWNVGTPTGLELYVVAAHVVEYVKSLNCGLSPADFSILSSDVSAEALSMAMLGRYSDGDLQHSFFNEKKPEFFRRNGNSWYIHDHIRSMIDFRQINLTGDFTIPGDYDVIFCHNVFNSLDSTAEAHVLTRFYTLLSEEGILFPGEGIKLDKNNGLFETIVFDKTVVYKKKPGVELPGLKGE